MPEIMALNGVSKHFSSGIFHIRKVQAVDQVSFALQSGKTFGLVGNSGCGKTTLSRMIMGLLPPTSGEIRFEGRNIRTFSGAESLAYRRRVQMIFQNPEASLDPSMRVRDSLMEVLKIHRIGADRDARMAHILEKLKQVNLPENLLSRYPHQISGGEGQRLVICRALLLNPEILILDEPTSMLDVSVQAYIMNLLKDLQRDLNLTYLYITHDIELMDWFCHDIAVMHRGKIVEMGSRDQIIHAPGHPYTQSLIHAYTHWDES